jgi:hypothetical protein
MSTLPEGFLSAEGNGFSQSIKIFSKKFKKVLAKNVKIL